MKKLPDKTLTGWWSKIAFFQSPLYDIEGPCLTFDLDVVIVDNIDCFFEHEKDQFCMKWDYSKGKRIDHGHSSCVMRFEAGKYGHIYDKLDLSKIDHGTHNTQAGFKKHKYWGDQLWITHHTKNVKLWPKPWIVKFSRDCHRDPRTKVPIGEKSVNKIGLDTQEFFVPHQGKVIVFSGKNSKNELAVKKIEKWWHAEDLC